MNILKQNKINNQTSFTSPSIQDKLVKNSSIFEKGTVLKGKITNIRYNEIDIQLEDHTTLTAKYTNSSELNVGQTASFKVVDSSLTKLSLEIMAENQGKMQNITIRKALEEANLPKNEKNIAIVKELLHNNMSIDKQSIQGILKQSYLSKDISIATIVQMNRQGITITEENLDLIEQLGNLKRDMINDVTNLASNIVQLMEDTSNSGSYENLTNLYSKLIDLMTAKNSNPLINTGNLTGLNETNSSFLTSNERFIQDDFVAINQNENTQNTTNLQSNYSLNVTKMQSTNEQEMKMISDAIFKATNISSSSHTLTTNLLSMQERQELIDYLHSYSITDEMKSNILNGSAEYREIVHIMQSSNIREQGNISSSLLQNGEMNAKDIVKNPLIATILESVSYSLREQNELASVLPLQARNNLLAKLDSFQLTEELKKTIQSGSITVNELLEQINDYLPLSDQESVLELFRGEEFKMILKEGITTNWTLTPKELLEEGSIDKLYQTLENQLDELSNLLKHSNSNLTQSNTATSLNHLTENIDFLKNFNQLFTYIQLPLKLSNQNAHGDLYVYTNKKQLQKNSDNVSVLLHLDLDHLGPLDVHIALSKKHITSKFYLNDDVTKELTSLNMEKLASALKTKGYTLNYELLKREKEIDIIQDFIEKDAPSESLKRYSFDIRA